MLIKNRTSHEQIYSTTSEKGENFVNVNDAALKSILTDFQFRIAYEQVLKYLLSVLR